MQIAEMGWGMNVQGWVIAGRPMALLLVILIGSSGIKALIAWSATGMSNQLRELLCLPLEAGLIPVTYMTQTALGIPVGAVDSYINSISIPTFVAFLFAVLAWLLWAVSIFPFALVPGNFSNKFRYTWLFVSFIITVWLLWMTAALWYGKELAGV